MDVNKPAYKKSVDFLRQLGLSVEQIEAYLYLLQHGHQTVLSLSRGLQTGRTKLYPLLEELVEKQLVVSHERHYGTSYEARDLTAISLLVNERERAAQVLRSSLDTALYNLTELQEASPTTSKIIEYSGVDGYKQIRWNMTKAAGEIYLIINTDIEKKLDAPFRKKITTSLNSRSTPVHILKNLHTETETYVYDNVVAMINNDLQGVEIHNPLLAQQQRQLFELFMQH